MSQRTAQVELVLGRDWRQDVRYLSELRSHRPADTTLNLVEICDIIDLVVDGNNLTAQITEESIFGFVAQLMEGLWSMAIGRNRKSIIEFHCEPWELCLAADAEQVLVSLYSVDRRQRVVAHDVVVEASSLIDSVARAAEELLADLFSISESFASDPFVRRFSSVLGKLRRVHSLRFPVEQTASGGGRTLTSMTTSGRGVSISYTLESDYHALQSYGGEQAFDQHALLAPGTLTFEVDGRQVVVCDRYPILAVREILTRVRELLAFMESSTSRFECASKLYQMRLDVAAKGANWRVAVSANSGTAPEELSYVGRPNAVLDGLLTIAEMVIGDLEAENEHLELNQRFVDLRDESRELRSWHADFADTNHYLEHPEQFLVEHGDLRPLTRESPDPSFAWPLGDVRALYPGRKWAFSAPKINFGAISTTAERLLVPTGEELVCLQVRSGAVVWRRSCIAGGKLSSYALAGDRVVAADEERKVRLLDLETGEPIGTDVSELGSLVVGAVAYEDGDLIAVADFHGGMIGLGRGGELRWAHDTSHGLTTGVEAAGPVLCLLSSPGFALGINPANGEMLWKVRLGGLADAGPFAHQGRIYTFSHDARTRQLTTHAMFPFTGRTAWQLRLEGWIAGEPDFIDQWMVVPIERHGKIALVGVDVESTQPSEVWRLDVLSAGVDRPTRVTPVQIDGVLHGVVRTDTAELTCFRIADGEIRWRREHERPSDLLFRNLDLTVVRDAVLCVSERLQLRSLDDGRLLHEFGEVMVAPEFVAVQRELDVVLGERGAERGDPDRLVAYATNHFLAVVDDDEAAD
jgi:outer membrane protein assembly factor BamB